MSWSAGLPDYVYEPLPVDGNEIHELIVLRGA